MCKSLMYLHYLYNIFDGRSGGRVGGTQAFGLRIAFILSVGAEDGRSGFHVLTHVCRITLYLLGPNKNAGGFLSTDASD